MSVNPAWLSAPRVGAPSARSSLWQHDRWASRGLSIVLDAGEAGCRSDAVQLLSVQPTFARRGARVRWTIRF